MRHMLIKAGLVAAVALVVAGPASAKAKSPCAVVSRADATKALGAPSRPALLQTFGSHVRCTYATANYRTLTIEVEQISKPAFEKAANADPKPVSKVSGVGDEAFSYAGGASLVLWKNGSQVTLVIFGVGVKIQSAEAQVGLAAAARL